MKSGAAGRSRISLPPPSSLRLAHPPATPVISGRGRVPYGCQEPLSEALSPCRLTGGGRSGPKFTSCQGAAFVMLPHRKLDHSRAAGCRF